MGKYDEYLRNEAEFQDQKIVNSPRARIRKVYNDASANYRYTLRNQMIGSLSEKRVLDLGCGNGFASMEALRTGAYVTAIDISPKSIECLISSAKKEQLGERLNAMVMDAHNLEFEDNTFDVVFGNGILHHLQNLDIAFSEIKRVLKRTGYAVFLEPLGMNPFLNLFRKVTPEFRTREEQPFRMQELNLAKKYFPDAQFVFFDCMTLVAKVPLLLGMHKLANSLQKYLICMDDFLLRNNRSTSISFFQKMSWTVMIRLEKE